MRAGLLDRRITIEDYTLAVNDREEPIKTWAAITNGSNRPAQVLQQSGRMLWEARKENAEVECVFVIRYLAGLNERQRIAYEGKYYAIYRIEEIGRRVGYNLYATAFPESES